MATRITQFLPFGALRRPGGSYIVRQPTLEERERDLRMDYDAGRDVTMIGHIHDNEEMRKATEELVARLRKEYVLI